MIAGPRVNRAVEGGTVLKAAVVLGVRTGARPADVVLRGEQQQILLEMQAEPVLGALAGRAVVLGGLFFEARAAFGIAALVLVLLFLLFLDRLLLDLCFWFVPTQFFEELA